MRILPIELTKNFHALRSDAFRELRLNKLIDVLSLNCRENRLGYPSPNPGRGVSSRGFACPHSSCIARRKDIEKLRQPSQAILKYFVSPLGPLAPKQHLWRMKRVHHSTASIRLISNQTTWANKFWEHRGRIRYFSHSVRERWIPTPPCTLAFASRDYCSPSVNCGQVQIHPHWIHGKLMRKHKECS